MVAPESSLSLIILNLIRHIASSPLLNCLGGDEVTHINRKSWGWRFQLMDTPHTWLSRAGHSTNRSRKTKWPILLMVSVA